MSDKVSPGGGDGSPMKDGSPKALRPLQVLAVGTAGACGLAVAILTGKVREYFQHKCPLYARAVVNHNVTEQTVEMDEGSSQWPDDDDWCDFVTFEGVFVFIVCFIMVWFYMHRDKERNSLFVMPPIVINSFLCLCSLVRAAYISDGYLKFCDRLCVNLVDPDTGLAHTCANFPDACSKLETKQWTWSGKQPREDLHFHTMMDFAIALAWVEPVTLALHVGLIMADTYYVSNPPPRPFDGWTMSPTFWEAEGSGTSYEKSEEEEEEGEEEEEIGEQAATNAIGAERGARVTFSSGSHQGSPISTSGSRHGSLISASSPADPPVVQVRGSTAVKGVPDKKVRNVSLKESMKSFDSADSAEGDAAAEVPASVPNLLAVAGGKGSTPSSSSSEAKQKRPENYLRSSLHTARDSLPLPEVIKRNVDKTLNIT